MMKRTLLSFYLLCSALHFSLLLRTAVKKNPKTKSHKTIIVDAGMELWTMEVTMAPKVLIRMKMKYAWQYPKN